MSLRPISRKIVASNNVWEGTHLPLCAVFTPMEELEDSAETKDDEDDTADEENLLTMPIVMPISCVPKCLTCGAPMPTSTTHYRPSEQSSKVLCYLCGETTSFLIVDQQEFRNNEYLDPELYNKVAFRTPQEARVEKRQTQTQNRVAEPKQHGTTWFSAGTEDDKDVEDVDDDEDSVGDFDFSTDTIEFRIPIEKAREPTAIWQLPAMACPPIWWIVVDGTVGNTRSVGATRNYWSTVGATLSKALEDIPPHVHVGLLTATGSRLASWDLTSAIPHVQQFPYSYDPGAIAAVEGGGEGQAIGGIALDNSNEPWDFCLVPANGHYKQNIEAAIRAMVDGGISGVFSEDLSDIVEENKKSSKTSQYVPLSLTLEILLEFMEQASHPGLGEEEFEEVDGDDENGDGMTKLRYAGGKILCLLGNPPLETGTPPKDDSMSYLGQPDFGLGGVSGACRSEEGFNEQKSATENSRNSSPKNGLENGVSEIDETDPTDLTASNLDDYAMPLEPDDLFINIGNRCAQAALGVDLIVLVPEEDDDETGGYEGISQTIPWYGLPLLRPLSDASGAPGPLMFGTANIQSIEESVDDDNESSPDAKDIGKFECLFENVLARTPWQSGMVFGVQMKMQLSPGLTVERTPITDSSKGNIKLASFLASEGLAGPAVAVYEEDEGVGNGKKPSDVDEDDDDLLWVMGCCDPHTSLTIDLQIDEKDDLPNSCETDDFGPVDLKPVMQMCTLFTCIETDSAEPTPNYFTVCKIRVSSVTLELVDDAESVYDGIDPEALTVVLFNKIVLDAYLTGFREAQNTAELWLQHFMAGVYESAKAKKAMLEEDAKKEDNVKFAIGDRLLDENEGSLEDIDILLGQGHFKTLFVPLLTYAIMQSDALRPCGRGFWPSMDSRLCAISQMASMTPRASTTTLAPALSVWSLKDDQAIVDSLPLSKEGILKVLEEIGKEATENTVFLLESTQGVLVFSTDDLEEDKNRKSSYTKKKRMTIGQDLESTIADALSGYRTLPPQSNVLGSFLEKQSNVLGSFLENNEKNGFNDFRVPPSVLRSMFLEDMPTASGDENFTAWKSRIAELVRKEIKEKEDKDKTNGRSRLSRFFFRKKENK